jgi:CBS domain-containing protein
MPTVHTVLQGKRSQVHTISSGATVAEAVQKMNDLRIGALVVKDGGHVVGIFTERDVLRRVVAQDRVPNQTIVAEVMTTDIVCCRPEHDVDEVGALMQERKVRHVPVIDGDNDLLGIVSMGDVNACHASSQASQIEFLNEYIYGRA